MIPLPPYALKLGAYGLILGAAWLHGCNHGQKAAQIELSTFKLQVEAAGRSAQAAADERKKLDEQKAKASDESYAKALVALGSDIERMRKRTNSSSNSLPTHAPTPLCAEGLRCFDREQFDTALREFQTEVDGFVAEGSTLKLRMDEAIKWGSRLNQ